MMKAMRLSVFALAAVCAACQGPVQPRPMALTTAADAIPLGDNPWAARQRTREGKRIKAVAYHDGRVYMGFGDWSRNTGPIDLSSWDVASGSWTWHYRAHTEAIERFRRLADGSLLVPYVDPTGSAADFGRGPPWREEHAGSDGRGAFYHVFDAIEAPAGLFLIGTRRLTGEPLVMRRDAEGWSPSLLLEGRPDWFWFAAVLDGRLHVQTRGRGTFRHQDSGWVRVDPVFGLARVRAVVSVGDRVAGLTPRSRDGSHLLVSDGVNRRYDALASARDLCRDEDSGWVYLLRSDRLERSRDLLNWETLPVDVPRDASALDVGGGYAWIGTARGRLWALRLPAGGSGASLAEYTIEEEL